ncbi:hypothetical protein EDB86DRAFT_2802442 [Lactarius hatsudake]|nr:hypothetical protein EDB86DRAFT_2802442 [Lactarius hatsudake]
MWCLIGIDGVTLHYTPQLLGALWNWTLYGVLVVQIYVYSYNFPGDRTLLKLLVYSVFLVETLQTALTGADLYYWFVSGFGNMDHLTAPYVSPFDVPIIRVIVALIVEFFSCIASGYSAGSLHGFYACSSVSIRKTYVLLIYTFYSFITFSKGIKDPFRKEPTTCKKTSPLLFLYFLYFLGIFLGKFLDFGPIF